MKRPLLLYVRCLAPDAIGSRRFGPVAAATASSRALQRVSPIDGRPPLFTLSSSGSQRLAENNLPPSTCKHVSSEEHFPFGAKRSPPLFAWLSPRSISIRQLHVSPRFHLGPIDLVIFEGSYSLDAMGNLILRGASRLDAFSAYPFRT